MSNYELARSPNTALETLDLWVNHEDPSVRSYAAWNYHTAPEILERLANDENYWVRRGVTWNPNTPQYIKDYLKLKQFLSCL